MTGPMLPALSEIRHQLTLLDADLDQSEIRIALAQPQIEALAKEAPERADHNTRVALAHGAINRYRYLGFEIVPLRRRDVIPASEYSAIC